MILLHLMGGLGNQMSQVAFSYTVARETNNTVMVDTTSYKHYKRRPCSIGKLKLTSIMELDTQKSLYFYRCRILQKMYHLLNRIFYNGKETGEGVFRFFESFNHLYSFDSKYYELKLQKGNLDIYGYFLIEPYYRKYYTEICEMFDIKPEFMSDKANKYQEQINNSRTPIALSLRLQDDYAKDKTMNVCTIDYYLRGIKKLQEMFTDATFFVFADDIEKAKKLDLIQDAVYISGMSDVEGMQLMKQCKHFLISNSSFSWWGAYLSNKKDKVIIAPDHWINNNKDYSAKYYENMIKIQS